MRSTALDGIRSNAEIGVLLGALAVAVSVASATTMVFVFRDMRQ